MGKEICADVIDRGPSEIEENVAKRVGIMNVGAMNVG